MASMTDLKKRKESIQSTGQITKAMKLVSTVKLQKARQRAENSEPYFDFMYETIASVLADSKGIRHPYIDGKAEGKKAVIVITSNRGLAGGYNANVVKQVMNCPELSKEDTIIYPVGRKGKELLTRRGYAMATDFSDVINAPMYADAHVITQMLLREFDAGNISEIYLAYTRFVNTVTQEPHLLKVLPVEAAQKDSQPGKAPMNYEMDEEEAISLLVPKYIASLLYGAFQEAVASENGARMQAMDNATSNAEEMIEDLALEYNRARQGSITQELTEIIAGANAIS
jgi:F-type H+-transporting ATPase subunit gamma